MVNKNRLDFEQIYHHYSGGLKNNFNQEKTG